MKNFRNILTAACLLSSGFVSFGAATTPTAFPVRLALAAPQTVDFSDLDLRDENNRPISSSAVRRRFEDLLNENLNRLLIENLTPLRRAWLDMLSEKKDAFADWLGRASKDFRRWLYTHSVDGRRMMTVARSGLSFSPLAPSLDVPDNNQNFVSTVFLLIASTRLIC